MGSTVAKKSLIAFLFLFLAALQGSRALAKDLTQSEKNEADFKAIVQLFEKNYALKDYKKSKLGIDLQKLWESHRQAILAAPSDEALMSQLQIASGALKDWHVWLFRPSEGNLGLGFFVERLEGAAIVSHIYDPRLNEELAVGDELVAIGTKDASAAAEDLAALHRGSRDESEKNESTHYLTRRNRNRHPEPPATPETLSFRRGAKEWQVSATWEPIPEKVSAPSIYAQQLLPENAEIISDEPRSFLYEVDGQKVGYMAVRSFLKRPITTWPPSEAEVRSYLVPYVQSIASLESRADRLILDFRGNGGGVPFYFCPVLALVQVDIGASCKEAAIYQLPSGTKTFSKPLAALIGADCYSGCELTSGYLQDTKRGPMIGENTAGAGGTATIVGTLPHSKMEIQLSIESNLRLSGQAIENFGIKPDIELKPLRSDLSDGYRSYLEKAARLWIGQSLQKDKATM